MSYPKGTPKPVPPKGWCSNAWCVDGPSEYCSRCGWGWEEMERRKTLPLVTLPNGLRGKIVRKK